MQSLNQTVSAEAQTHHLTHQPHFVTIHICLEVCLLPLTKHILIVFD